MPMTIPAVSVTSNEVAAGDAAPAHAVCWIVNAFAVVHPAGNVSLVAPLSLPPQADVSAIITAVCRIPWCLCIRQPYTQKGCKTAHEWEPRSSSKETPHLYTVCVHLRNGTPRSVTSSSPSTPARRDVWPRARPLHVSEAWRRLVILHGRVEPSDVHTSCSMEETTCQVP